MLLFLSSVALLPALAHAQSSSAAFSTSSSTWDGYAEVVRLAQRRLGTRRVVLTKRLDYSRLSPGDALMIVHPTQSLDEASLSAFLADGGRIGLLDDFGQGDGLLHKFGIRRIAPPPDPAVALRNNPDLAVAVPSTQVVASGERGRHPMAAQIDQVVTNHPRGLAHPDLTPVLELPSRSGDAVSLAVTGVIAGKGRLFALGDPSVFINLMMRYPGNRHLAEGLVEYLAGSLSTRDGLETSDAQDVRASRLYILTNQFEQLGHYGDEASLGSELQKRLEDARNSLLRMREDGLPDEVASSLAVILAIWLLLTQLRSHVRVPKLASLTFARAPAIAGQAGWSARAHLLASEKTNPLLPLMELDSAVRETIAKKLRVNPSSGHEELCSQLAAKGLSSDDARQVADLVRQFRRYGLSLSEGKPARATAKDLETLHEKSMRLIAKMEHVKGDV